MKSFREYLSNNAFEKIKKIFKGNGYQASNKDDAINFINKNFENNFRIINVENLPPSQRYGENITITGKKKHPHKKVWITIIKNNNSTYDIFWEYDSKNYESEMLTPKNKSFSIEWLMNEIDNRKKH